MTGIAGWVGHAGTDITSSELLVKMLAAGHAHDGAVSETVSTPAAGIGVQGWPSDLSVARIGDVLAVVYGIPVWKDDSSRAQAASDGHAAAVVSAWRDRRIDLFAGFGGPVSLAIIDTQSSEALISIDRIGIRQMAFAPVPGGGLVFASDARAVCAHPAVNPSISRQALFNYLYFYVSPGPPTIFEGIEKLQPGQFAHLRNGTLAKGFYWQPEYSEPGGVATDTLAAEVRDRLKAGVGQALASAPDEQAGAFLSGGLDSTTVSGYLAGYRPGAKCFTIAFPEEKYNELPWAQDGARHFGVEHITHVLTPEETIAAIPGIVEAHDEPYGNSSSVPAYVCARLARDNGVGLLLAGDGGDEIFAGNERYIEQRRYDAWYRIPGLLRKLAVHPLLRAAAAADSEGFLGRARAYADRAAMPLPDRLQAYNIVATTPLQTLFNRDFLAEIDADGPLRLLRDVYQRPRDATELKRMHFLDLHITLADNDLRKVNRACELAGIRVAYPMLDENLVACAASIPTETLLPEGRLRGFYKDAMGDFLPPSILNKQKHGFGMPFSEWTRVPGELRDMADAALGAFADRDILAEGLIGEIREDLAGVRESRFGGLLWDIMMLELWLARHADIAALR